MLQVGNGNCLISTQYIDRGQHTSLELVYSAATTNMEAYEMIYGFTKYNSGTLDEILSKIDGFIKRINNTTGGNIVSEHLDISGYSNDMYALIAQRYTGEIYVYALVLR